VNYHQPDGSRRSVLTGLSTMPSSIRLIWDYAGPALSAGVC
jgi:hypothetical protein